MSAAEEEQHLKAPLYLAAEKGHVEVVKALLNAGADVHATAVTTTGEVQPMELLLLATPLTAPNFILNSEDSKLPSRL